VRRKWIKADMEPQAPPQPPGHVNAGSIIGAAADTTMAEPPRLGAELPPPDVKRWTIRRKAAVVAAIAGGLLTEAEACERYQLSPEELSSWQRAFEAHGLAGLRSTRLQQYRGRRPH
jgi:hypothetical protein